MARKNWEAEEDAHTMAEAEAIRKDPKRLMAAQRAAMGILKQKEAMVQGLRKLTKKKGK